MLTFYQSCIRIGLMLMYNIRLLSTSFKAAAVLFFFFLVIAAPSAFSDDTRTINNHQRIIPLNSEIYPVLDILSISSGTALLSSVKPYSEAEVLSVINRINYETLSQAGKNAYNKIIRLITPKPVYTEKNFAANITVKSALELYLHTSKDESNWLYGYEDRLPIFSLPTEVWFNTGFYGYVEPQFKESRFLITAKDSNGNFKGNISNIPSSYADFDYYYPERAFFSVGKNNWNLEIGRDKLETGNGQTGNLVLSSYPDYYNFAKVKGFADNFTFTWMYVDLENPETMTVPGGVQRAFIDHVLEARLFNVLSVFINESMLLNGQDPEIQYINPLIIYHNLFIKDFSNSLASVGFSLFPFSGLNIYGEFALDQLQTAQEQELYGSNVTATPNADGYMIGTKGVYPLGNGFLSGDLEYVYTSPWLYIREGEMSFFWYHRELTDVLKTITDVKKPLGYRYGPDAMVFSGKLNYYSLASLKLELGIEYILKGQNTIETPFEETGEAALMKTPSGIVEKSFIVNIKGEYQIFPFLSAGLSSYIVNVSNYNHITGSSFFDFQNALNLSFKF